MRELFKRNIIILTVIMCLVMLPTLSVDAAKINKSSLKLEVGKSVSLKVTGTKKKATWSTSNKKIATVSKGGRVKAVRPGKAVIRAKISKKTYKCTITVTDSYKNVKINKSSLKLEVGKSSSLKITGTKKKATWSTSNKKIVTVNKSGRVKAVKAGKATISAKVGEKTYKCTVTIDNPFENNYKEIAKAYKRNTTKNLTYTDKKVLSKVKTILAQNIKSGMTDLEKARAIHDWLILNNTYESYREGTVSGQINYYDALFRGKANCAGFTGAYQLFMECLGIQNEVALSAVHGWNVIKLDGEWYNVDVTYDNNNDFEYIKYYMFLIPDKSLPNINHPNSYHRSINNKKKCTSEKYILYPYQDYMKINNTEDFIHYLKQLQNDMVLNECRVIYYLEGNVEFVNRRDYGLDFQEQQIDGKGGYILKKVKITKFKE